MSREAQVGVINNTKISNLAEGSLTASSRLLALSTDRLSPVADITIYMLPIGKIIRQHGINFHCYADDTQLYLSINPDEPNRLGTLQACLEDIKNWMTLNFLLLNQDKTEVLIFGPEIQKRKLLSQSPDLNGITLISENKVRNLGVIFDQDMSFKSQVKQVCRISFFHLRNIAKIRSILSKSDAEKLVHAFITSRLDYCNSLLSGSPQNLVKSLQLVQNAAARVLMRIKKRDHISPVLASLHWLPVKFRIDFKILLLTYKALNNQAPSYISDLIVPYVPNRALRSQTAGLLVVPRKSKIRMGGRSFSYQAPLLWNQLPALVREADTLSTFKNGLKTFLFDRAYVSLLISGVKLSRTSHPACTVVALCSNQHDSLLLLHLLTSQSNLHYKDVMFNSIIHIHTTPNKSQ
ncbi:uncharacterized protein [Nothobranchius furzeri]|uniref:uncharacterized protein n=1 Tax=Nothobranchius furzeri TaxID=105023 RepID=UPI00390470BE